MCILYFLGWVLFSIGFVGFEEVNRNCLKFRVNMGYFGSIFYALWVTVPYPIIVVSKWVEDRFL